MRKKILLLLGVGLILFVSLLGSSKRSASEMTLRVAFPYDRPATAYEPTRIHLGPEYIFLENIYSPLIELSKANGTPVGGVAESFEWRGGELHLQIRKDLTTIDGLKITAKDVEFSLKRLLLLSENTHGNFKDLICPNEELSSIDGICSGITVDGQTVILKSKGERAFLVSMLAAIDFAIIPRSSVDPESLKIVDYRNTSGPYYVASDDKKGSIKLLANNNHYNYSSTIPQEIILVPSGINGHKDSLALFQENKVDFITTIDKLNPEKVIEFSKSSGETLHSTMNIRTFILTFTEKGLKKYNRDQRLVIGKKIRGVFRDIYENISGYEETNQFFPALGDGSLTDQESNQINSMYEGIEDVAIDPMSLSIVRIGEFDQYIGPLSKAFPGIKLVDGKNAPNFLDYKTESDVPDCFISGPDTGFMEDIGLISYSMYAGFFGMDRAESNGWLAEYMNILDKPKRLERLKSLHFKVLHEAVIIPLVSAPYVALARRPWKIELSQIYANNPLWLVVKE